MGKIDLLPNHDGTQYASVSWADAALVMAYHQKDAPAYLNVWLRIY